MDRLLGNAGVFRGVSAMAMAATTAATKGTGFVKAPAVRKEELSPRIKIKRSGSRALVPPSALADPIDFPFGDDDGGNGGWVNWMVIDLTGELRPRKNLFVRQYFREAEDVQIRAVVGGFEKEELEVVVQHGFISVRARYSAAVPRALELPDWALNWLFELRFALPRNACIEGVTAQAGKGILRIIVPKSSTVEHKRCQEGEGGLGFDRPLLVAVTDLFVPE